MKTDTEVETVNLTAAIGSPRGRFTKKECRAAKLLSVWDDLTAKFEGMVRRGNGTSLTARCAYATLVMMETGIRIGNEKSSEGFVCENKHHLDFGKTVQTYGLTTLRCDHVARTKKAVVLTFTGKKLVGQTLTITSPVLLKYCPTGSPDCLWLNVTYRDLVRFVKKSVGKGFTPKDIRTAKVNRHFVANFVDRHAETYSAHTTKRDRKRTLSEAVAETAEHIGHTSPVCKKSYLSSPLLNVITNAAYRTRFTV